MTNSTQMAYLLPHLLEQSAMEAPDHQALRFRDESCSYAELHGEAAKLAHGLIEDGLQLGERVGILLDKGLDSAVALYGIMMAGGVYVPLDPTAPTDRTRFVVRDCGIRRLVSSDKRFPAIRSIAQPDGPHLDVVFGLHEEAAPDLGFRAVPWSELAGLPSEPPPISTTEQDLCYILYTSGSTGTPKGIMHTHRSALAWAEMAASAYGLHRDDVISNYGPLHFDQSTLDYFAGARAGATTLVIPAEYTKFPASLAGLIEEEGLSVLYCVPMALIQLTQPGILDDRNFNELRLVLFGGEPMPIKHLRKLMQQLPQAEFVNVYGPTEVNGCTHHRVPSLPAEDAPPLPIGRPYPNVEALIVDANSAPVAEGEPGELLIRAPTMMRGYWGRDDLNEGAFFLRNRYGGLPEVFHRTGDLASTLPDGTLAFLGRKDRQVKSRGYRVELDEIETVLSDHDDVREAAVYTLPTDDGTVEIHAAVIVREGVEVDATELVRHLRNLLPPYAVPVRIESRTAFPRTSSGKTDRQAMVVEAVASVGVRK